MLKLLRSRNISAFSVLSLFGGIARTQSSCGFPCPYPYLRFHTQTTFLFPPKGKAANMHQTKIGQFFKRKDVDPEVEAELKAKSSVPDASPVKKPELQVKAKKKAKPLPSDSEHSSAEEDENEPKTKTKKALWKIGGGGGGEKRKRSPSPVKEKKKRSSNAAKEEKEKKKKKRSPSPAMEEEKEKKRAASPAEEKKTKKRSPSPAMEKEEEKKKRAAGPAAKENKTKKRSPSPPVKEEKKEKKKRSPSPAKEEKKEKKKRSPSPATEDEEEKAPKVKVKASTQFNMMGQDANPKGWDASYDPSRAKYHPIDHASWNRGERVPYLALAKTLEAIEATSSRLKFIEILANYFRSVILLSPEDLLMSVYLCLNKLAPAYEGVELGVAETNVMKAIAQATGRSMDKIKADANAQGDLGLVAESSRSNQKTLFQSKPLTVSAVFSKLKEVAAMSGQASHAKKISMITSMLVACKHSEARYLTRSLLGKLRVGLAEQSLLQAIAQATFLTPPDQDMSEWPPKIINAGSKLSTDAVKAKFDEQAYIIKSCYCECPNYDILVKALMEVGVDGLSERCKLTPGIPPRPMLAQPTKGVSDVLDRFEGIRFTCEYKYDGERAQIHLMEDGSVRIYSRNQEDNTSKYPDILARFKNCIKSEVTTCILDSEAVAWDLEKEIILPFQVLSTRKRKDANEADIKVQVCVFAFDIIYLNGESLVKKPLIERRELLRSSFQEVKGQFMFATSVDTNSTEQIQEFLEESLKGNCEGLMVKTLDERASYELAKRSQKWLKLKKDYLDAGGDSLDLVVIGGFHGKGKRTGTYGGFLLASYEPSEEVFQTICKIGTGFSDDDLQKHSESLKSHVIPKAKSYYRYNQQLEPDVWFDAVQVWEVKCADLSLSPVHTAAEGLVDPSRGISLRFPRFLRIREDKNAEDATSAQQVADLYRNQEQVKNNLDKKDNGGEDDEFY